MFYGKESLPMAIFLMFGKYKKEKNHGKTHHQL
jgi:hypothetical protein